MGFQPTPQLPDYQKLKMVLTNSGVQKWNPPTYDILSRLIDAVAQSQNVIINTTIPDASTTIINNLSGSIIPPDERTITTTTITGFTSLRQPLLAGGGITFAVLKTLNTIPVTVIPAVAGSLIIPLWVANYVTQSVTPNGFSGTVTPTLRYDTIATDIMNFGEIGSNVAIQKYNYVASAISAGTIEVYNVVAIGAAPIGKALKLRSAADRAGADNLDYLCRYQIGYVLLSDPGTI